MRAATLPYVAAILEATIATMQKSIRRIQGLAYSVVLNSALTMGVVSIVVVAPASRVFGITDNSILSPVIVDSHKASALKGINIGNDQSSTPNSPYQSAQNEADLAYLKGKVSRIRIALAYGLDANDVRNLKRLAIEAKKQGFYVQFGITAGADSDINTYYNRWLSDDIVATAIWAQANHIDEFAIGNEEDWYRQFLNAYNAKTPREIRDDVRAKVADVRKVYSGSIVYADAESNLDDWIHEGIGGLDRIYFNVFDSQPNFQNIITKIVDNFGVDHGGITEWAAEHGYNEMLQSGMSPEQYGKEIMDRAAIVKKSGLPAYMFTLRMDPSGSDWGLMLGDGTKRPGLDEFLAL
ncbi:MAG TPA: hypothetical protein VNX65_01025 [Patescibacteria group bacterium]|nr:hypothetical protein [Patescibacteria group bacterium]